MTETLFTAIKSSVFRYVASLHPQPLLYRQAIAFKLFHTRRVCRIIVDLAHAEHLSDHDCRLAETAGLLHDVGRFEQFMRYGTYNDRRSENHGQLGVHIIKEQGFLKSLDGSESDLLIRAVSYHNSDGVSANEPQRIRLFSFLVRDADKLDIFKTAINVYEGKYRGPAEIYDIGLPKTAEVSPAIVASLLDARCANVKDIRSLNDFKLVQMSWMYDLNFQRSFQIVGENNYLERIVRTLPQNLEIDRGFQIAQDYIEKKAAG